MPTPQNLKNHMRLDPPFHFFILPMLLLNLIFSIYVTIHHWPDHWALHLWWIAMSADDELPALVRKTLTQNLEPKAIKQSIVNWRGDYHRV